MPNWLVIVQAVITFLQSVTLPDGTTLLQEFINIINKIITAIAGGFTPVAALWQAMPDFMKLYAKVPIDKRPELDALIVKLTL